MDTKLPTGAEKLIQCLERDGVEYIFGLSGGAAMPIFDAFLAQNIKPPTVSGMSDTGYLCLFTGAAKMTALVSAMHWRAASIQPSQRQPPMTRSGGREIAISASGWTAEVEWRIVLILN